MSKAQGDGPGQELILGIDIGGTFTDVCVLMADGTIHTTKVSSTPPHFEQGFFAGIGEIADELGVTEEEILRSVTRIGHGTTVATNALITRDGARVGLVTTAGHGEAITIMRGEGRTAGLGTDLIADIKGSNKPTPFLAPAMIEEVAERTDRLGETVVALDETSAREAIGRLLERGADSFAVCLLWSIRNGANEQRIAELIREATGGEKYVTTSSGLTNRIGEYERSVVTVLNSFVAGRVTSYLDHIADGLAERSFGGSLVVMQASGGVATVDRLSRRPIATFQSGPVAGVIAAGHLGEAIQSRNLIAGDVGGTSFDVALVVDGQPEVRSACVIDQHSFYLPAVDVRSIGAGGGSIARFDPLSQSLRVGPESAGAVPGPACYGRGGAEPTVTDASLTVGFLDPEYFLGGRMSLDVQAAQAALAGLAGQLALSADEAAAGVLEVVEHQMADLIRGMTVARGHDPRDFDFVAYGGAGPQHAANLGREIGARRAIVPLAAAASAWSALGVAAADLVSRAERSTRLTGTFAARELTDTFAKLDDGVVVDLGAERARHELRIAHEVEAQYEGQIHQVRLPVEDALLSLDDASLTRELTALFTRRYADLYGEAATLGGTPIEILVCRSVGTWPTAKPSFRSAQTDPADVERRSRPVYWRDLGRRVDTPTYRLANSVPPNQAWDGPCLLEMSQTTVVVPMDVRAATDSFGNIVLTY